MRNVFIVLGIMAILVIGWMLWISTPDSETLDANPEGREGLTEEVSLVGKTVCLTQGEAQAETCTFGFVSNAGESYLLDTERMQNGLPDNFMESESVGDGVRITGTLHSDNSASAHGAINMIRALFIEPANGSGIIPQQTESDEDEESDLTEEDIEE